MSQARKKSWWLPDGAILDEAHLVAIGAVIPEWSLLEAQVQNALCELAQSPLTLGQALTEDLGPDNRLKALTRLVRSWEITNAVQDNPELRPPLDACLAAVTWIKANKDRRNRLAHWTWMRDTDEAMFGMKYSSRPYDSYPDKNNMPPLHAAETVTSLLAFETEIEATAKSLFGAVKALQSFPTWPRRYQPRHEPLEHP
jgi:hypothetical protein